MAEIIETQSAAAKKFGNYLNILVILVVILAAAGGGWYWNHNRHNSKAAVSNLSAGWSEYTSDKYSLKLSYPTTWGAPLITEVRADKGKSYNIVFRNQITKDPADKEVLTSVSINFDSHDMTRKVCAADKPTNCATIKGFSAEDIRKLMSEKTAKYTIKTSDAIAIVSMGPTPNSQSLSAMQIVNLPSLNISAVRASYTITASAKNCSDSGFSPESAQNCITHSVYDTLSRVIQSMHSK